LGDRFDNKRFPVDFLKFPSFVGLKLKNAGKPKTVNGLRFLPKELDFPDYFRP
jgi:hypothetical protein